MARLTQLAILFAGALCLISLPDIAHSAAPEFYVQGEVYCEVCRADFINKLSEPMSGAKVLLECKGDEEGNVTYSAEAVTNEKGVYRFAVKGDHEDETCDITLVKSSRPDCDEIPDEGWATKPSSRVSLTANSGMHDDTRKANPLAFAKKVALPECAELLKELEVIDD
ncbi:hypothetical protein ACJIZ3_013266 [Penstemon smallii]|uniref:Uncharacterized protein n=1 Tax=Penstemon smallii TaxID=265156 RepID=A0ABD3UPF3_9LAMI